MRTLFFLCCLSLHWLTSLAQEKLPTDAPPGRTHYLGRVIAQTMSYHGAPWLTRTERRKEEHPDDVMKQLDVDPGMTVCDLGCGNGYYTLRLARAVTDSGKVLAVDVQPEMLQLLRERVALTNFKNIEPILSEYHDPHLPADKVDLLMMVDVYHEFSHPDLMLQAIRRALTAKGVIALLEYREEDPNVPIKPLHKMSKAQILKEYSANGLKLVKEYDGLPWQHLMFFGRDESWTGPAPEVPADSEKP
jgi:ubiquinone/menaquinone biosynthesis C-methylase UbiE